MRRIVDYIVRLIRAGRKAYERKWSFAILFAMVFLASVAMLARLDLLPQVPSVSAGAAAVSAETKVSRAPVVALPTKIEIPAINLSATVENPATTAVATLDEALLNGAVRYPTSAKLGEIGNVVLFGHSSYLPIVRNQAYKTFNGIQKLVAGDVVIVYSSNTAYTYRVKNVTKESANDNSIIPLSIDGKILTLVTCNSFAKKQDRFVVTADFVESHSISS